MSSVTEIRKLTGTIRPGGNHGCSPVEVIPGLWTSTFADVNSKEKLAAVSPAIKVVVNAATEACNSSPGFYGDGVNVVRVENFFDSPDPVKKVTETERLRKCRTVISN
jgi:hypothetical protein